MANHSDLKNDLHSFTRKLQIEEIFYNVENTDESLVFNKSSKHFKTQDKDLLNIVNEIELLEPSYTDFKYNITLEEKNAIQELKTNKEIILKPSDKGGGWIIMDSSYYENDIVMKGHLNTSAYERIDDNADKKVFSKLKQLVNKYKSNFTNKEVKYLTNFKWKSAEFYCRMKTHKSKEIERAILNTKEEYIQVYQPQDLKGRPIVAGPESPTQRLSHLLEILLKPIVPCLTTYIKDDWDFLKFLPREIDYDCDIYSCDIESLYTSLPTELGLEAINYWINLKRNLIPTRFSNEFILEALEFVLCNNNFRFNMDMFHQILGTAMGTKCAPPYACLTIGYKEEESLFKEHLPNYFSLEEINIIKRIFKRYMDDGFLLWPSSFNFNDFCFCLNNLHPSIRFTFEKAEITTNEKGEELQILNFLDVKVILNKNTKIILTDIYYKTTNTHDYLPYNSAHPSHVRDNVPFNLAKRIIVFVSCPNTMKKRLSELRTWLTDCGYPEHIISKAFHDAALQGPAPYKDKKNTLPFVTTYHSNVNNKSLIWNIRKKIENSNSDYLKEVFNDSKIILAQRQPKNLLNLLTNAKYNSKVQNENNLNGLHKCTDKRCKICKLYINECSSFTCSNGIKWEIRSKITCSTTNVLYYLKCNMCRLETYIGKTIGDVNIGFKARMNNHISESRTGISSCKFPRHVYHCGIKNGKLNEPYFEINIMLTTNDPLKLEYLEKHFQNKGYDTLNNPARDSN